MKTREKYKIEASELTTHRSTARGGSLQKSSPILTITLVYIGQNNYFLLVFDHSRFIKNWWSQIHFGKKIVKKFTNKNGQKFCSYQQSSRKSSQNDQNLVLTNKIIGSF